MKKKIKYIVLVVVIIVLSFFYAHIDKNTYLYDRDTDSSNYIGTGILLDGETISQEFVCEEEFLDSINLKSTIVGNVESIVLEYAITDNESNQIVKGSVKGTEIRNNKFNKCELTRINNSKNKTYTLTLKSIGADGSNGISFYIDPEATNGQEVNIRGQETQGSLVARTITHRFDFETFIVLIGFVVFVIVFIKILYKLFK